ncbi:MAG: VWA domain-containing protein [Bacteroidales bacterium]
MVRVPLSVAMAIAAALTASGQQQTPRFKVDVARILVDTHVVDAAGSPILGLTAADFAVRIDGRPARVEHARWVASESEAPPPSTNATDARPNGRWTESSGRLIVLVFQRSMEPSRLAGLVRMQAKAARFIGTLGARDRVAIVWFDSHLKLAADFTSDRAALARLVLESTRWTTPGPLEGGTDPSLASLLDYKAADHAASVEQGLLVLAHALSRLPGPKITILFGWGFGRLIGGSVQLDADYAHARTALVAARTSVFSVDVTDAASHSLEVGLRLLAEGTGGDYVRTNDFADAAFDRVARIVAGQYELAVEPPVLMHGDHTIDVQVPRRHATVFARKGYTD